MVRNRYDETWHRLREWTKGQAPSERLAAQILLRDGFTGLDPSHPLGGRDGGKDAMASKEGVLFAIAVYFPRGAKAFNEIRSKFESDHLAAVSGTGAGGFTFVTNQELTLGEREQLRALATSTTVDLYHLERITMILDLPDMANIRQQFLDIEPEGTSPLFLGGLGGSAPGAGGGGGAAIGSNASGGKGGQGGDIVTFSGLPGSAPGAGGGGAGAIGEGAVAGEGGGGGERVSVTLGPDDLSDVHHFEFQIGQGGVGGGPGEDTIVNLCAEDGRLIRKIVAKGGMPGAPPYVPPQSRTPTRLEIDAGMKVTSMLAAEFIRCRDGLWTIVEGGWDWIQVGTNPFRYPLPLYVEVETGLIDAGTVLDLKLVVLRPDGFHVSEHEQKIVVEDSAVKRTRFAVALELVGSQPGVWRVQILAGPEILREYPIEVRVPATGDT